jgi:hypothetical protein
MNKLKNRLRSGLVYLRTSWQKCSLKQKIWWLAGGLVAPLVVYLLIALSSVSAGEVRLAELAGSWTKEKVCHEACASNRRALEEAIIDELAGSTRSARRTARRLEIYFLDEDSDAAFRQRLVSILGRAFGPDDLPPYLSDYLAREDGQADVRAAIIDAYGTAFSPDYYLTVVKGSGETSLKQAAVRALSVYPDKAFNFSVAQLATIGESVFDKTLPQSLRAALVLLLSDYYSLFPTETDKLLRTIYGADKEVDVISRAFAADILNRHGQKTWLLPDISEAQWAEYYNN